MTRTPTLPLDDRGMWRKAIARTHPDAGGSHELCVWIQAVRDVICGGGAWPELKYQDHHQRPTSDTTDRVPFDSYAVFEVLTDRAVTMADAVAEPYGYLLRQLADCQPERTGPLHHQQRRGASYKSLAAIGHRVGMTKAERSQWYRIAGTVPLSQRHAGHILSKLQRAAA
jgi:hypothetical protein